MRQFLSYSILGAVLIAGGIIAINQEPSDPVVDTATTGSFEDIDIGMDFRDVESLLGGSGELLSEAGDDSHKLTTRSWGSGFDAIVVSFADGKVSAKSRLGQ